MQKYLYRDLYELEDKHWWHINKREICIKIAKKYTSKKFLNILDLGCGTGKNVEVFDKLGRAEGLDNSPEAIKFCKKRNIKAKLGSVNKTPFKTSSFDLVTALDVLEHVDDAKALKEIRRILKKDGYVLITVPAFQWLWSKWDEVLHHKRRYTINTLSKVLEDNGFRIVKISYMYSFLVIPALVIRFVKNILYKNYYPSDFKLSNGLINSIALNIARFETSMIINQSIPIGTSLICLARKYEEK